MVADKKTAKGQSHVVQVHAKRAEGGLKEGMNATHFDAETGDEACQKALSKHNYPGVSIRGCTLASDQDAVKGLKD